MGVLFYIRKRLKRLLLHIILSKNTGSFYNWQILLIRGVSHLVNFYGLSFQIRPNIDGSPRCLVCEHYGRLNAIVLQECNIWFFFKIKKIFLEDRMFVYISGFLVLERIFFFINNRSSQTTKNPIFEQIISFSFFGTAYNTTFIVFVSLSVQSS